MPISTDKDLPENSRQLWLKALSAVELRNYDYAISLIQAVLKDNPGFLDGRKRLRKVELAATAGKKSFLSGLSTASLKGGSVMKKDPLAAMELAEKGLEKDPRNAQANHLLKDAAKAAGFPEIAAFALETIIDGTPQDTKLMHELGELYMSMGDSDKAVEVYSKIASVNPADMVAVKRSKDAAATATMKKGGWEKEGSFKDKLANKEEAAALEQKSRIVRDADALDALIAELYPVWEADQSHVDNSKKMAKLYEERNDVGPSPEALDGAIYFYHHCNTILNGSDPGVLRKLSDLQMKKTDGEIRMWEDHAAANEAWLSGEGAQAGEDDRTAAQQAIEDAKNQAAELRKGRAELLIGEARRRIERNPTDLQLRYELGELLVNAGQFTEAIEQLQRARQNPNARIKAMRYLGVCFKEKGMLDFAAKQLKEASTEMLAMDVTKKEILYELGLVYELMGKKDEALACFKEIYEVDYGYRDVAQRVESSYGG
jgi:tetratricopeptide (TPR) repeat protein